jgi:transposase
MVVIRRELPLSGSPLARLQSGDANYWRNYADALEASMGHKKVGVPSRRYTNEFKIEAVKLGQSVGMSGASRRLGIPDSSLFNWVKLEHAGKLGSSTGVTATPRSAKELEAEVDRLRRELASAVASRR